MSYNLLLDTNFIGNNWKFTNCVYDNGMLISNKKIFGIEQELTLPKSNKLYFRSTYKSLNCEIFNVKIGIQSRNKLDINQRAPKYNTKQDISVIDTIDEKTIKVHIIFESLQDYNKVMIQEPLLVDLGIVHKYTWLKSILDKKLKFRAGYSYDNLYEKGEIDNTLFECIDIPVEKGKVGSIITTSDKNIVPLKIDIIPNHYYLCKLDYEEINKFGNTYLQYGSIISESLSDTQQSLIFRADTSYQLNLMIENTCELPYCVNLKHILLIDITTLGLMKDDILTLPFI